MNKRSQELAGIQLFIGVAVLGGMVMLFGVCLGLYLDSTKDKTNIDLFYFIIMGCYIFLACILLLALYYSYIQAKKESEHNA